MSLESNKETGGVDQPKDQLKQNLKQIKNEVFKPTGETLFIVSQTTRPKDVSKLEAKELTILESGEPCLFHYYTYSGTYIYRALPTIPKKKSKEFTRIAEVTPLDPADLEKKGYQKKKISRTIPIQNLVVESTLKKLSEDQIKLILFEEVIKELGVFVNTQSNSYNKAYHGGGRKSSERIFNRQSDLETKKIISDLKITNHNDGTYDVDFYLYEKSRS
jgi:hypothetical protein